jgi:two-component system, sensor histidine kinase LadS
MHIETSKRVLQKVMRKLAIVILFFCLENAARAESSVAPLLWKKGIESLSGYLSVLEDKKGILTIDDILKDTTQKLWRTYSSDFIQFGYTNSAIWFRLDIDFDSLPTEPLYWWFDISPPQDFRFYHIEENRVVKKVQTGINFPFAKRDIPNRWFIGSFRPIKQGKSTVLVRIHNNVGSLTGSAHLSDITTFGAIDRKVTSGWYVVFTFMGIAALFSLGLCLAFRERIYAYYFGYIFCSLMLVICTNGFGAEWFWGDSPILANSTKVIWSYAGLGFLLLFVYRLLFEVLKDMAWLRFMVRFVSSLMTVCFFLALGFSFIPIAYLPLLLTFGNFSLILTIFFILLILSVGIYKNQRPAYYFLFAFSPVVITGIIILFRNAGYFDVPFLRTSFILIPAFILEILLLFLALLIRFQTLLRIQKEKIELELATKNQLQLERERISRDLHDNLGAQLSHIVRSAEWLSTHKNDSNSEEKNLLEGINESAKQSMTTLRDSIWTLNKEHITVQDFAERFKKFAQQQVKSTPNINLEFKEKIDQNNELSPEQSLQIYRILQEALNNALKYANATKINITLQSTDNQLFTCEIKDNGIGFDVAAAQNKGNGLENMTRRAESIGAEFKIDSKRENGTVVRCQLWVISNE